MRPPSLAWSWLNRRLFSSVAPYSLTGMVTSPNEIAPFQIVFIGRAAGKAGVLLLERRPAAPAPPGRPAAHHAPDARRAGRGAVLREAGARPRAELAADRRG